MIELEDLSIDGLEDLFDRLVRRVKFMNELNLRSRLDKYQIGDFLEFRDGDGWDHGTVVRINRKSLSIATEAGRVRIDPRWTRPRIVQHAAENPPQRAPFAGMPVQDHLDETRPRPSPGEDRTG